MTSLNPSREEFEALLNESFETHDVVEGAVVKGVITAIEKDQAVIDVGLKVEGRVPTKEFGAKAKDTFLEAFMTEAGDTVLIRNYCCPADQTPPNPHNPDPQEAVTLDGKLYFHWNDVLTDHAI